jgi:hypothetical protein
MSSLSINQSVNTIFLPYEYDRSIDFVLLVISYESWSGGCYIFLTASKISINPIIVRVTFSLFLLALQSQEIFNEPTFSPFN